MLPRKTEDQQVLSETDSRIPAQKQLEEKKKKLLFKKSPVGRCALPGQNRNECEGSLFVKAETTL